MVSAMFDPPKPVTSGRMAIIRQHRILCAGLGFAVTVQTTVYLLFAALPVIASEIANHYRLSAHLIAFYYPLAYTVAFLSNFCIPKLLLRLGGAGLSLVCMAAGAAGLILMLPAAPLLIVAATLALGVAIGGVTPATSQVVGPSPTLVPPV
jgi:hypothetical protein